MSFAIPEQLTKEIMEQLKRHRPPIVPVQGEKVEIPWINGPSAAEVEEMCRVQNRLVRLRYKDIPAWEAAYAKYRKFSPYGVLQLTNRNMHKIKTFYELLKNLRPGVVICLETKDKILKFEELQKLKNIFKGLGD